MKQYRYLALIVVVLVALSHLMQPMTTLSATSTPPPEPKSQKPIRPSRRDSPNDRPQRRPQPESSAEFGAAAIGDTIVTHNLPKVTFRVNDGFDLDQYLYADSSPLNFEIDLKGYKVAPGKSAKVTLNVYDIDSAGGDGCQPEVDKLYLNGTFLTDLTGANDEWRLVTVDVPGTAFNPGRNMFEVQIDTLGTGCWAVEVDWAEVEIDFNIAQLEANALDDVTIKRGKTDDVISDTIWKTVFTASGAVDPNADPNDPIAGKIRGAGEFTYKYKLDTWPTGGRPTWQPKVKYQWEIQGSSVNSGGVQELTGWEQDITVKLPDKVGKYTLRVTLEIYDQDKLLRTEVRSHPLYVLLDTPVGSVSNSNGGSIATGQPKAAWLDVALDSSNPSLGWAAGKQTEVEILEAINTREYANPFGWVYGYYAGNPFKDDAITLLENGAGKRSDCFVFRDVWRVLAGSLGITTSTDEYRPPRGFMTSTRRALEGGGNARPVGSALDRWVFGNHQYGTYNGRFYDPTFGLVGPNTNAGKEGNLFCKIDGVESGRIRCRTLQQPPAKALLRPNMGQINGWSIYEYETFNTLSVPSNPSTLSSIAAAAGSFTGTPTDQGVDTDGNGLYEQLRVNVPLNVTQAGTFGVTAILAAPNGEAIALGSVRPELLISGLLTTVDLPSGQQTLSVYFNGYDLRTFNAAGPYTVMLELTDETGTVLDTSSFTTSASNPQSFQGPLVAVQTVTDQGINADATPGFEHLRVTATLNAAVASTATISAQIFAGESLLDTAEQTLQVAAGSQQVDLSFAGQSISASRADGPYTVYISVSDPYYPSVKTHTTAAYRFTDFQRPAAYLTGTVSDQGTDTNGNGQFETLTVAAEVSSLVAGTYTLYGRLKDSADALIATAETTVTVDATNPTRTAMLQFSGPAIYSHQVNGPYSMALVLADAGGNDLMDLQQTTGSYLYGSFEQPAAALTGSFADSGIDSDGNGLFNRLQIAVGVQVGEAGAYAISGSLLDSNGGFVTSATTESTLSAGAATVNLNFDGGAIRQHGANGPYRLVSLSLRKLDGTALDSMVEAHQTSAYQVTQFQSTGLITGNFTDRAVDANGNGLFEHLIIDVEVVIPSAATYTFNGRIVDSAGAEIAWTSGSQTLSPGVRQVSLRFEGRSIHAHGVDGQYQLRDLHVYSNTVSDRRIQAYTTAAYQWNTFEPAAMIRGTVTNGGQPVPNATITLSTLGSVVTDINGAYQFPPVNSGTYTISISANASLAPWRILANGTKVSQGTSATLNMPGGTTTVDFISATANPSCPPQGEDLCVRLSTAAASVDESTSSVTFGAVLSAAASYPVTVSYATSNGTAMAGSDYTAASGTLTFAPGETSKTISVPIRNDVNDEPEETFRLALTTSKDLIIEAPATATVTIQDNDAPPAVSLSASSYSVGENAAAANITVRLSAASAYTVTVEYATSNGTATAGSDYTTSTGTVTFAPGEASKIISVPLLEDGLLEPNETFTVSLSSPSNATLGTPTTGTVTISANDTITFSASAYSVGENAAAAALTVRLNAASAQSVTVEYATSDGTATAGSDYTASTGTVTFAPGETSKTISVPLLEDGLLEPNETFTVSLSSPSNAGLGTPATATVTISSNDAITFSASAYSVGENAAAATLTVRLNAASAQSVTVEYATGDGTATAGSDYTTSSGTVTFAPGETSKTISIPLLEDGLLEANETFTVSLSNPANAGLGTPATATVTINANDTITFSASTLSVGENAAAATLTVRLNVASAQSVTVEYATSDGTATAGSDYTTSTGTVTFDPGQTSKTISIPLLEDGLLEGNETFTVSLSSPNNAGLSTPATATVTINANDAITFSASTLSVGENAAAATLTVRLNVASAQSVTVEYATSDGTATAGSDYTTSSGTVTFAPGETSKTVSIPLLEDGLLEGNETFTVSLSSPSNAGLGTPATATVTINANDTITFSASTLSVGENAAAATLTVRLNVASAQSVTVEYATSDGTATAGSDYTTSTGTVTFDPGQTSKTISIPLLEDGLLEGNETFTVSLSSPSNAGLGTPATATVTINANDTITFSASTLSVGENAAAATLTVRLNAASAQSVTVEYATGDGTATAGSDYTTSTGTVTFDPGQTSKTISIPLLEDGLLEGNETFTVSLSSPSNAGLGTPATATVTINANDTITFSASTYSVGENAAAAALTVRLNAASAQPVTVEYATSNGTATAGSDYTTSTGTVTFDPGQTSKTISIPLLEDGLLEGNETFTVSLSSPNNAGLGTPATATVTINANDTITFSASTYSVQESATSATLTVRLNAASAQPVTVEYATSNGTATAGSDYTTSTGTVTFDPGQTSKTISVPIINDTTDEPNETVTITLSNPANAALGSPGVATLTIVDND